MRTSLIGGAAAVVAAVAALAAAPARGEPAGAVVHGLRSSPGQSAVGADLGTSTNWAGYAVTGASFDSVGGSWVQPSVTCAPGASSYAAFWVGLGGWDDGSSALEQIGTESDCRSGTPAYSVWYELVPAPVVDVPIALSAGDGVTAQVSVSGTSVSISITNTTTGATFSTHATAPNPDLSSAEWVAEAPSQCARTARSCRVLPLASFGTISFSGASATASGITGTISNAAWSAHEVRLGSRFGPGAGPSALSSDGSSFSVSTTPGRAPSAGQAPRDARGWGHRGRGRGDGGRGRRGRGRGRFGR